VLNQTECKVSHFVLICWWAKKLLKFFDGGESQIQIVVFEKNLIGDLG
jgi:hypothetical protein